MGVFYPIEIFADWLVHIVLDISEATKLGSALHFFVYDFIKIIILLMAITFVMGLINVFFPVRKVKEYLTKTKLFGFEYLAASFFGTLTPFCSCSSVPLFIGFLKGGIPLGVTLAFLISSPLVDSVVVAMLLAVFGLKVTLVYVLTGIVISVISGYILGKMNLERYLEPWVLKLQSEEMVDKTDMPKPLISTALKESMEILKTVFPYLLVGIGIGAVIHGYVPTDYFAQYLQGLWAVPIAVLAGVPIYVNAAGMLPVGQALVAKSVPIGTTLAFMMSAVALSVPSGIMLKKVMAWELLFIFFGVVTVAIIFSGYFFNLVI